MLEPSSGTQRETRNCFTMLSNLLSSDLDAISVKLFASASFESEETAGISWFMPANQSFKGGPNYLKEFKMIAFEDF